MHVDEGNDGGQYDTAHAPVVRKPRRCRRLLHRRPAQNYTLAPALRYDLAKMADLLSTWTFVPLYGLRLVDDDGLDQPLFGDATLVSPEWYVNEVRKRSVNPNVIGPMTHQPIEEWLPNAAEHVSMPRRQLYEVPPHSYIAVRRRDDAQATEYAESLRAMLTATMFLRARRTAGFSLNPTDVAWSMIPRNARILPDGRAQSNVAVSFNERVFINPLIISKNMLRRSRESGYQIDIGKGILWDIHKVHPVCRLLVGNSTGSDRKKRMRALAIHLARTCCASNPVSQVQMAITAMEIAFGTNDFSRLRDIAHSFLPRSKERSELQDIETARHEFVHQGKIPDADRAKRLGIKALMLAYVFFDISVGYLDDYPTTEKYTALLDAQATAAKLAASIEQLHGAAARTSFEEGARKPLHPKSARFTLRADGQ